MTTWLKEVLDEARQRSTDGSWPRSDFAEREIARIRHESQTELRPVSTSPANLDGELPATSKQI